MYRNIVVAVDLAQKELAGGLVAKARELRDSGGVIRLVYVLEDIPAYVAAEIPPETLENRRREALEELRALGETLGGDMDVEVRSGAAASGILDCAEEQGADLIMIASHKPGVRDYFIGSTAGRVVRHARCSVLVVR